MFYRIFFPPQVKRCAITTYKHGMYESLRELPNDLRLTKVGNNRKVSKLHKIIAQYPAPMPSESLPNTS